MQIATYMPKANIFKAKGNRAISQMKRAANLLTSKVPVKLKIKKKQKVKCRKFLKLRKKN